MTRVQRVFTGLVAGLAGTAAMTGWQELSSKLQSSGADGSSDGEGSGGQDPWGSAPAPAKAAREILKGVFGREVPEDRIGLVTSVMHWGYGTSWGALYGLIQRGASGSALRRGALFGTGVWGMSYLTMVPMGIYQFPWKYSPGQLALDLSYHLVYGTGVGTGYALLGR